MAQGTLGRPGSQEDQDDEIFDPTYNPQTTPLGDSSDPRSQYDPQITPLGDPSDPRSQMSAPQRPGVYDAPGSHYDEDEESRLSKIRKGVGAARDLNKGVSKANNLRKRLRSAEKGSGSSSGKDGKRAASPSDLSDAEDRSRYFNDDDDDGLFNPNDDESRRTKAKKFFQRHKKKAIIGGGIGGLIAGGGVGLFLVLLPLKIEHIVDNLESSFFSSSQQALQTETRNLIKGYLISRVMPGYKSCGGTIKPGCSAWKFGSSPVANLYRTWADARIERDLASKGIRLEYKKAPGKWYLETPTITGGKVDIGPDGSGLGAEFDNHAELRAAVDEAVKKETKWYQVYQRYKWGRYFERKFGLPRCVIVCRIVGKDNYDMFHGKIHDKKIAAKLEIVRRVITPHNQTLGIVLECLITDCPAADNEPSGTDGEYGTPRSATDQEITDALRKYGGTLLDNVSDTDLLNTYKEIEKDGLQKYLIKKALTPIIGDTAAGAAGDVIPIAGWINFAAQLVNTGNDASSSLKKLRFEVNATSMALLFSTWLIYRDEIHSGNADATEVGSFANSLGPGDQGSTNGPPAGGTASAEQTKLYQALIEKKQGGGTAAASTALLSNPLTAKAYAVSPTVENLTSGAAGELCNNGLPVPANDLICAEDFLGGGNSIANSLHNFLNSSTPILVPGTPIVIDPAAITAVAQGWKDTFGLVFNFFGGLLGDAFNVLTWPANQACGLPSWAQGPFAPYCGIKGLAESIIPSIVDGVTRWLIPDPFGVPMGGGRQFVLGAGGADYLGNDSAHRILGAQAINPQQKAQIQATYNQDQQQEFDQQSFFARMFDGNLQNSLVSKLAMDVPLGGASVSIQDGLASLLNPLGILGHGFSSIFSSQASADPAPQDDPFGITQYGYPAGTIPGDPETYWKDHCSDNEANAYQNDDSWNQAASGESNADPNTGEPLNKTTNPCLLIMATVGAAGGLMDTSNLTQDDLADLNNGTGGSGSPAAPTGTGGYQNPFTASSNLSATRVDEGVDYTGSGPVHFLGNAKVTYVCASGCWEGESFITYQLLDGPAANKYVYVAEGCTPASGLKADPNKTYSASDVVCNMYNGPHGIETGWAAGPTQDVAAAHDVYVELSSGKSYATAYGQNFEELMESLGVNTKACYDFTNVPLSGKLPNGWPTWTTNPATKAGSNSCG